MASACRPLPAAGASARPDSPAQCGSQYRHASSFSFASRSPPTGVVATPPITAPGQGIAVEGKLRLHTRRGFRTPFRARFRAGIPRRGGECRRERSRTRVFPGDPTAGLPCSHALPPGYDARQRQAWSEPLAYTPPLSHRDAPAAAENGRTPAFWSCIAAAREQSRLTDSSSCQLTRITSLTHPGSCACLRKPAGQPFTVEPFIKSDDDIARVPGAARPLSFRSHGNTDC